MKKGHLQLQCGVFQAQHRKDLHKRQRQHIQGSGCNDFMTHLVMSPCHGPVLSGPGLKVHVSRADPTFFTSTSASVDTPGHWSTRVDTKTHNASEGTVRRNLWGEHSCRAPANVPTLAMVKSMSFAEVSVPSPTTLLPGGTRICVISGTKIHSRTPNDSDAMEPSLETKCSWSCRPRPVDHGS
jgi:hypothetical protein